VRLREGADGRARYVQRNPKAKLYVDFADFSLRRLEVEAVHFNGGFGRADKLVAADILTPVVDAAALIDAEDALLAEINAAEGMAAQLAGRREAGRRIWRAIGLDAEGVDLAAGGAAARVSYPAPAFEPQAWRARLAVAVAASLA
jgi:putative heme iron utilization protein